MTRSLIALSSAFSIRSRITVPSLTRKSPIMTSASTATDPGANQETPWHAAFPSPRNKAPTVPRAEVLKWLKQSKNSSDPRDFVLVDLRRADHEGGTVTGSLNLPAQSLYNSIPTLYTVFKQAGIKKVAWYCGSSLGRGTRAGGWFFDYLLEHDTSGMQSLVLEGGIKGWVKAGDEYVAHMDGYDASVWENQK